MSKTAVISGHGAGDPGAVYGYRVERDIVERITGHAVAFLRQYGEVEVITDLDHGNFNMTLSINLANAGGAESYVAIHANSAIGNPEGAESLIYPGSSAGVRLAECIRESVQLRLPIHYRRTIARSDLGELSRTAMPAVIWECGFLQSDHDSRLMIEHAKEYGEAIAMGIMDYHGLTHVYLKPQDTVAPTADRVFSDGDVQYGRFFKVYAHGVADPSGIQSVVFAVWTAENGQDDLQWYDAKKESEGVYSLKIDTENHNKEKDLYIVHCYATDGVGNFGYVGATSVEMREPDNLATGDVIPSKVATFDDSFSVRVDNVTPGDLPLDHISFAVWTDKGGQDDLRWVRAEKVDIGLKGEDDEIIYAYEVIVHKSDYGDIDGVYITHAYGNDGQGNSWYLGGCRVKLLSVDDRIRLLEEDVKKIKENLNM